MSEVKARMARHYHRHGDVEAAAQPSGPPQLGNRSPASGSRPSNVSALLATLPTRVPRDAAAALVTRHFFRVSKRSLERWPVVVRQLNGRAHIDTAELFDVAQRMCEQAPSLRGSHLRSAVHSSPD